MAAREDLAVRQSPLFFVLIGIVFLSSCDRREKPPAESRADPPSEPIGLADLNTLVTELPKLHKNLFFRLPEALWRTLATDVEHELPKMNRARLAVMFATLVAAVGDGHTGLALEALSEFGRLPVQLRMFPDGLYVIGAGKDHAALRGKKLVRIGRHDVSMARAMAKQVISHDNAQSLSGRLAQVLVIPEVLHALGITDRPDHASVETSDGGVFQLPRVASWREVDWFKPSELVPRHRDKPSLAYWNDYLPGQKTLYFKYNRCADDPAAGMTFAKLVEGTLAFMKTKPVERFVLDLRDNGGGDSTIAGPLIAALAAHPTLNVRGRLFVLIGRHTFSSAVLNALELKAKTQALLVGEPTGGRPNHYGEVRHLTLPRTGWQISYSTKYFTTDLVKGDPDSLVPDLPAPYPAADWFAGHDPVLDAALNYKP